MIELVEQEDDMGKSIVVRERTVAARVRLLSPRLAKWLESCRAQGLGCPGQVCEVCWTGDHDFCGLRRSMFVHTYCHFTNRQCDLHSLIGNYATDIQAGASYRFKLLFMVFLSNVIAVFLQALCAKLSTITSLNLAENCRAHLPRRLNYTVWLIAEAAIIATDISEVIGAVIALNMLLHIPLIAGCATAITDVIIILLIILPE